MKCYPQVAALAVVAAVFCIHTGAFATQPSAGGSGSVGASNRVSGSFSVVGSGSSVSYASARNSASANVQAGTTYSPGHRNVSARVAGDAATESSGVAYNVSTGAGRGSAASQGSANAAVQGRLAIDGVTRGFNGGSASTEGGHVIRAGTNQGSYAVGSTRAGFEAQVDYSRTQSGVVTPQVAPQVVYGGTRDAGVRVTGTSGGYASGTNSRGALAGMNAAGVANVTGSGRFDAGTNMQTWLRPVRQP